MSAKIKTFDYIEHGMPSQSYQYSDKAVYAEPGADDPSVPIAIALDDFGDIYSISAEGARALAAMLTMAADFIDAQNGGES